jgi:hypothetical protein
MLRFMYYVLCIVEILNVFEVIFVDFEDYMITGDFGEYLKVD